VESAPVVKSDKDTSGQRHRPLVPVLTGAVAGIALDGMLHPQLALWLSLALAMAAFTVLGLRLRLRAWANWLLAALLLVAIGGAYHAMRSRLAAPSRLKDVPLRDGVLYYLGGRVREDPLYHYRDVPFAEEEGTSPRFCSFTMQLEGMSGDIRFWLPIEGQVTVFVQEGRPDVHSGDRIEVLATFRRQTAPGLDQGEGRAGYVRAGSIGTATVASAEAIAVSRRAAWYRSPVATARRLRSLLRGRLGGYLPTREDRKRSGLMTALLFGQREALTPDRELLLEESGTLHFLAISGLHVGIFCLFLSCVLAWSGLPVRSRLILTIACVWAYVAFTGCHVSALRAGLMLTFLLAAPLLERRRDSLSALMAAALLILVVSPQQLFAPGFQLTFAAMWALIAIYPQLKGILWPWEDLVARVQEPEERSILSDLWLWARSYLTLSCIVWLATAPIRVYHFNNLSLIAPLLNLVVWPLVLVLLVVGFVLLLGLLAGGLGAAPLVAVALFVTGSIETLLAGASHLPGFGVYLPSPPLWWIGLFYFALAAWTVRGRLPRGRGVVIAAVLALAATYVWHDAAARLDRRFEMTVADVGQGQTVAALFPGGQVVLFDAGSAGTRGREAVGRLLWQAHAPSVDVVAVSHFESDHCNLLPYLMSRFRIGEVVAPAAPVITPFAERVRGRIRTEGVPLRVLREGDDLHGGRFRCEVLHPDMRFATAPVMSENDRSLVFRCECDGLSFLLPGDIGAEAMRRLSADYGSRLQSDVLVMPHHGRYDEGLEEFLDHVRPRVAIVSGTKDGCHPRTVEALETREVPVWITGKDGAVTVGLDAGKARVSASATGRRFEFSCADVAVQPGSGVSP